METDWTDWSPCCKLCTKSLNVFSERFRTICTFDGKLWLDYETKPCEAETSFSEWTPWSDCNGDTGLSNRSEFVGKEYLK